MRFSSNNWEWSISRKLSRRSLVAPADDRQVIILGPGTGEFTHIAQHGFPKCLHIVGTVGDRIEQAVLAEHLTGWIRASVIPSV